MNSRLQASRLDEFDRKILTVLQKGQHDTAQDHRRRGQPVGTRRPETDRKRECGKRGLSGPTLQSLIRTAVGQSITIFVEVEVISETAQQVEDAKKEFAASPEIQQCYYVTGEADFVLVIVVPTMTDYRL